MNKKSIIAKRWLGTAAGSVIAMSASVAQAAVIEIEGNDTFATANAGGTNTVSGTVGDGTAASVNDVDIFSFNLVAGQAFSSNITFTGIFNPFDTRPVTTLYWDKDDAGSYFPVATTDPFAGAGTSFNFTPWATGNYFLAVTGDANQGVDAFGNRQSSAAFLTSEFVLGTSFAEFDNGSFTSFSYEVSTLGAVPVPAAVWLFGSGLLGLVGVARRRNQS